MSIGRICIREVDVINPDESARVAASRMHSRKVGTLIVVDEAMAPVGLLTDRDLTTRVLAEGKDGNATPVSKVMSPAPSTVEENTSIEDALAIMRSGRFAGCPSSTAKDNWSASSASTTSSNCSPRNSPRSAGCSGRKNPLHSPNGESKTRGHLASGNEAHRPRPVGCTSHAGGPRAPAICGCSARG